MKPKKNKRGLGHYSLIVGGTLVALIALAHIGVIIGGPNWYRAFGAGESMASMAEQGSWIPGTTTAFIVLILSLWALYAFSAAQLIRHLPFLRTALIVIASILIVRGGGGFVYWMIIGERLIPNPYTLFMLLTSLGSLFLGLCYLIGLLSNWTFFRR